MLLVGLDETISFFGTYTSLLDGRRRTVSPFFLLLLLLDVLLMGFSTSIDVDDWPHHRRPVFVLVLKMTEAKLGSTRF